jgi:hypothetical protein
MGGDEQCDAELGGEVAQFIDVPVGIGGSLPNWCELLIDGCGYVGTRMWHADDESGLATRQKK